MQHVYLRQTRKADLEYVLAAERGEDNRPFIIPWTREQHLQAMADRNCAHLIAEANTKVGYVILAGLLDPNRSVEFRRIVITDKGHGYGRAVVTLVKQLAFNTYKAHRLWLDVKEQNARARRLYQQSGFIVEGTLRECLRTGNGYDSLVICPCCSKSTKIARRYFQICGALGPAQSRMTIILRTVGLFVVTATAEILGCYLPYLWLKQRVSGLVLVPAGLSLATFAYLLSIGRRTMARPMGRDRRSYHCSWNVNNRFRTAHEVRRRF